MSGKVIWHVSMSVDGFIAGAKDELNWVIENSDTPPSEKIMNQIDSIGAILGGRRWWDVAEKKYNGIDGIYGGAWTGPVFVLTHNPPAKQDHRVRFLNHSIPDSVSLAKEKAKGKNVLLLGANLAQQCIESNVVDHVVIHMIPVFLGKGVRLIEDNSILPRKLKLEETIPTGQVIELYYNVQKD